MSLYNDDMNKVADWGELLPEDWYHVRIAKVTEAVSKESNQPVVNLQLVCQEEPFTGKTIPDICSLQPHALAKLKAYYKATGQGIMDNGHDPELLMNAECWVKLMHKVYKSERRGEIPPYGIKSLLEGRPTA